MVQARLVEPEPLIADEVAQVHEPGRRATVRDGPSRGACLPTGLIRCHTSCHTLPGESLCSDTLRHTAD
jgi:hypothetical protein